MNKITSGLISVFALGLGFLNVGVAFGEGEDLCQPMTCADGYIFNENICDCELQPQQSVFGPKQQCEVKNTGDSGTRYVYEGGECVDKAIVCITPATVWDYEKNECLDANQYCSNTFGVNFKWDSATNQCYDSNAQSTVLPYTELETTECEAMFIYDASHLGKLKSIVSGGKAEPIDFLGIGAEYSVSPLDVLGCGIKTGRVKLWMVPFYIKYLIQFALGLAGLVAVGAVLLGGYFYLFSGVVDDKEKGKKAIMYGIAGFVVAIMAWTIVNAVIAIATR